MPAPIERLILHIGTYKTGTSSVQRFLDERRSELQAAGICYPQVGTGRSGTAPGHHDVALVAGEGKGAVGPALQRLATEMLEEFAASGCRTLILSAEDFSGVYYPGAVLTAFPAKSVEIYVSLRPQHEILSPLYYTAVAMRIGTLSPQEYLDKTLAPFLDYYAMLSRWRSVAAQAKFHVRRFERGAPARDDSIADFVRVLALPVELPRDADAYREHRTLPARGTIALRAIAGLGYSPRDFYAFFQLLHLRRDLLGKEMSIYPPSVRRAVDQRSRESNARLREEFVDGVHGALFQEPAFEDDAVWQAEIGDEAKVLREVLASFARSALASAQDSQPQAVGR